MTRFAPFRFFGAVVGGSMQSVVGSTDGPALVPPQTLASYRGDERLPVPVVVTVRSFFTEGLVAGVFPDRQSGVVSQVCPESPVGPTSWTDVLTQGYLRFEYGSGDQGVNQVQFTDIRSGEFQLPPCTNVLVQGKIYHTPSASFAAATVRQTVEVSLAPGLTSSPADPTQSGAVRLAAGAASYYFPVPPTARLVRYALLPTLTTAVLVPVDVQLEIEGVSPTSYVDYSVLPATYVPDCHDLVPLAAGGSSRTVRVHKTGGGGADAFLGLEAVLSL